MDEINNGITVLKALKQVMDASKQRIVNKFKDMNVTGPQGILLGTLSYYGEMKISDLSEKVGLSNSTVSGIIDRLESQGLVKRIRSTEDRRVVYVSVTPEFELNAQKQFKKVEKMFETIISRATQEEINTILEGLSILKRLIESQNVNETDKE